MILVINGSYLNNSHIVTRPVIDPLFDSRDILDHWDVESVA
ncbi:MAG TPA: hypothetical protein VE843_02440 [Ktedonobacteraceae bacterium]|nr:hypothetical protein [Ktedonobacteraceae bacterium]